MSDVTDVCIQLHHKCPTLLACLSAFIGVKLLLLPLAFTALHISVFRYGFVLVTILTIAKNGTVSRQ